MSQRLIKTEEEIAKIKEGGKKIATILVELGTMVKPGLHTSKLEHHALMRIEEEGGRPAFKGYKTSPQSQPFPTALCISINDEIVHGPALPGRVLKEGDIISIDVGMEYPAHNGYFTDTAITVPVGKINKETKKLVEATYDALYAGIKAAKPGNTLDDIGCAVEAIAKKNKLGVIRDLVGHGVGLAVHEDPQVPNYHITKGEFPNVELKPGMVIAIEPMFTLGDWHIDTAADGFTFVTADGSLSAHFEHTIVITKNGNEIITKK